MFSNKSKKNFSWHLSEKFLTHTRTTENNATKEQIYNFFSTLVKLNERNYFYFIKVISLLHLLLAIKIIVTNKFFFANDVWI